MTNPVASFGTVCHGFCFITLHCSSRDPLLEEFFRGNHSDTNNIFRWDVIYLNLPGNKYYKPSEPWVCKLHFNGTRERTFANDLVIYVDDARTTAYQYDECRLVSRRVASLANYLGLQDAARKCRDPSGSTGPWAGSIVCTPYLKEFISL
jgi:hypothetical protein